MGKPKKRTSARKTGLRRSHLVLKLARMVNSRSPVKVRTTKNESGKMKNVVTVKTLKKAAAAPKSAAKAVKPAVKKPTVKKK